MYKYFRKLLKMCSEFRVDDNFMVQGQGLNVMGLQKTITFQFGNSQKKNSISNFV